MRDRIVFAIFAAGILFSMVREWSAPVACERPPLTRTSRTSGFTR